MFSVVNELIDHFYVGDLKGYKIKPRWKKSPYKSAEHGDDVFSYYFEPLYIPNENDVEIGRVGKHARRKGNLITPTENGYMDQPKSRDVVQKIIEKYFKLKKHIIEKIDDFEKNNFKNNKILGVHLRSGDILTCSYHPLNSVGVDDKLKQTAVLHNGVPYDLYFEEVDRYLNSNKNALIFLCSDSTDVIKQCKKKYGSKIITYDSIRSDFGETHHDSKFSNMKYKLGEDILIEAYLLCKVDYLIHGMSNVTNFVLCNNSKLKNHFIYSKIV
jgi:hypothetical protein